jgi:hypothetical protein
MVLYDDYEKAGFFMPGQKTKAQRYRLFIHRLVDLASLLPVLVTRGVYLLRQ